MSNRALKKIGISALLVMVALALIVTLATPPAIFLTFQGIRQNTFKIPSDPDRDFAVIQITNGTRRAILIPMHSWRKEAFPVPQYYYPPEKPPKNRGGWEVHAALEPGQTRELVVPLSANATPQHVRLLYRYKERLLPPWADRLRSRFRSFLPVHYGTFGVRVFGANQSVEPTGGSLSAQTVFVSQWRLPPVAHAHSWTLLGFAI